MICRWSRSSRERGQVVEFVVGVCNFPRQGLGTGMRMVVFIYKVPQ